MEGLILVLPYNTSIYLKNNTIIKCHSDFTSLVLLLKKLTNLYIKIFSKSKSRFFKGASLTFCQSHNNKQKNEGLVLLYICTNMKYISYKKHPPTYRQRMLYFYLNYCYLRSSIIMPIRHRSIITTIKTRF